MYNVLNALTSIVEAVMYFFVFEALLERRYHRIFFPYIIGVFVLSVMITICNGFFLYTFSNLVALVISAVFVSFFLYVGKITKRILTAVISACIISLIEVLVLYIVMNVFGIGMSEAINITEYWLLGVVTSKLLGLAACNIIRIKGNNSKIELGRAYWLLFFILFTSSIVVLFLVFRMGYELGNASYNEVALASSIGLSIGVFFSLYLYERLAVQSKAIREQEQREQYLDSQIKHLDELFLQQEELRRFKHDISNQLITLKGYFSRNDSVGGQNYIDHLTETVAASEIQIDTGNTALDAILSTKKALAESKGITFKLDLHIPERLPIDPNDICIIFGNALDNAIEACEQFEGIEKQIEFCLRQRKQVLSCSITNTAVIDSLSFTMKTSKKDKINHGYGLLNLSESLAKYDSEVHLEQIGEKFILRFIIFLAQIR